MHKKFCLQNWFFCIQKKRKIWKWWINECFFFVVVVAVLIENWNNGLNFKFLQSIKKFYLSSILFSRVLIIELIARFSNKWYYLCKQYVLTTKHAFFYHPSRVKSSHTADHGWKLRCVGQSLFSWRIDFGICWWS